MVIQLTKSPCNDCIYRSINRSAWICTKTKNKYLFNTGAAECNINITQPYTNIKQKVYFYINNNTSKDISKHFGLSINRTIAILKELEKEQKIIKHKNGKKSKYFYTKLLKEYPPI